MNGIQNRECGLEWSALTLLVMLFDPRRELARDAWTTPPLRPWPYQHVLGTHYGKKTVRLAANLVAVPWARIDMPGGLVIALEKDRFDVERGPSLPLSVLIPIL